MLLQITASTGLKYLPSRLFQRSGRKCNKFLMFLSAPQMRECRTDSGWLKVFSSVDIDRYITFIITQKKNMIENNEELAYLIDRKVDLEEELKKLGEMSSEGDKEFEKLIDSEKKECIDSLENVKEEILYEIIPKEEDDDSRNAELKIIPGIGGDEAKVFSQELYEMYFKYAEFKNWQLSGTIEQGNIIISGEDVFGELRHEGGVHRVQRVPGNDTLRRIHTSTCSVVILPQPKPHEIKISEKDIIVEKIRSSGPGGQNVNKRETCVRIKHIATGIAVENQTSRFQFENMKEAINKLRSILFNIEQEKLMAERQKARKEQAGTNDYSDKIRTYNFQQNRVTDHRINQSCLNLRGFMSGGRELESFIKQVREQSKKRELISSIKCVLESDEYKTFEKQKMS